MSDAERVEYDVAILGGGPAGSAAALALVQVRPELRVVVVEPSAFDGWRIGETLAPGGRQLLEGLGCWERVRAAGAVESHGTIACWGDEAPYENEFLFSARGSAWHLDRAGFDAALLDAVAAAGVEVRRGARFIGAARGQDGAWTLTLAHGAARDALRAGVVIDATGRAAAFASRAGAQRAVDDALIGVAVMCRFDGADTARDTRTLVEAQRDGWSYSAAIPGDRVVVAWMSDADLVRRDDLKDPQRWLDRVRATQLTRARVDACTPEWPVRIWSARSQRLRDACGDAWIAVGDAASAFDPLSSAGVVKALYSGKLGAFAVLDLLRGVPSGLVRYRQYVEREYAEYLTTRSQFYGRERRWRDSPFWSRRTNGAPSDGNRIVRRERPAVPLEFRCSKCGQVKDVRTLRASVCPECTASAERDAVVAADAGLTARKHYETALARGPHYTGALEDWTPKDPVLLADGQHFVCPACKRRAHLVHDLAYRWQKKQFPIPTKYTPCDDCHRKETDDTAFVRPRNRFSRER